MGKNSEYLYNVMVRRALNVMSLNLVALQKEVLCSFSHHIGN